MKSLKEMYDEYHASSEKARALANRIASISGQIAEAEETDEDGLWDEKTAARLRRLRNVVAYEKVALEEVTRQLAQEYFLVAAQKRDRSAESKAA